MALLLALAQFVYWLGVRRYFSDMATAVSPAAILHWQDLDAFPPGRIVLNDVRLAVAGKETLVITAERVSLLGDDPLRLALWTLGLARAPESLTLRLEGLRASDGFAERLRRASRAGFMLPFEAFGCRTDDGRLAASDYEALGWTATDFDLDLRIDRDRAAGRLTLELLADRAPAGALRLALSFGDVPERGIGWAPDLDGARLERLTLDLHEQGTLAARNRHCAARAYDGALEVFVSAHLEQLHAWLGSHGMVPDEPVWALYRRWLDEGGPLHLVGEPALGVPFDQYGQFAPQDRLRLLGVSARLHDGEPVPVEATAVRRTGSDFRPLPPLSEIDPGQAFERVAQGDSIQNAMDDDETETVEESPVDGGRASESASAAASAALSDPARHESAPVSITFPELPLHLGRRIRVDTVGGNRHHGVVLDATSDAVELEISRYGGGARLPIAREQIKGIELLSVDTDD